MYSCMKVIVCCCIAWNDGIHFFVFRLDLFRIANHLRFSIPSKYPFFANIRIFCHPFQKSPSRFTFISLMSYSKNVCVSSSCEARIKASKPLTSIASAMLCNLLVLIIGCHRSHGGDEDKGYMEVADSVQLWGGHKHYLHSPYISVSKSITTSAIPNTLIRPAKRRPGKWPPNVDRTR